MHFSVFALEKQSKNVNFQSFLPLKYPLVTIFKERCALTFNRKYVSEIGKHSRFSKEKWIFFIALLCFCFRKAMVKSKFSEFFTSKRPFCGYFQQKTYTCFNKICSWTRYNYAKFIRETSVSLVVPLRFSFRKTT